MRMIIISQVTKNHYQVVVGSMYVCICNSVTDREIKKAVKQGIDTFDEVRNQLGVSSCCGQCENHAREVINEACTAKPTFSGIPLIPVSMPHLA